MNARILIIDGDPAMLAILRASVADGGFDCRSAVSGEEALELFKAGAFDAVLMDLGLTDIEGGELLHTIRALSDVPIIVVSGRIAEEDKIQALDLGADDYVAKPFLPGELLARIRAALRRARTRSEGGEVLPRIGEIEEATTDDPCYSVQEIGALGMAGNADRTLLANLAEEAKHAARTPGLSEETRSLLDRVYRALMIAADRTSAPARAQADLESVARMIESEAVIWPEDVDLLASLAARVRNRVSRDEIPGDEGSPRSDCGKIRP